MGMFDAALGLSSLGTMGLSSAASIAGSLYQTNENERMMRTSLDFQGQQSGSVYQRGVRDLEAAGLNPMLAYTRGDPAAGGAGFAGASNPGEAGAQGAQATSAAMMNSAQTGLIEATKDKATAEAAEIRARTPTYAANIEQIGQNIRESIQKIQLMQSQAAHEFASAGQAEQQTQNLQAQLPQIKATIAQLQSLAQLQGAQRQAVMKSLGKTDAEISEIQQRVNAALPSLQRQLLELDRSGKQLDMPRREQESGASAGPAGVLGAILRTLNPLSGLIGAMK